MRNLENLNLFNVKSSLLENINCSIHEYTETVYLWVLKYEALCWLRIIILCYRIYTVCTINIFILRDYNNGGMAIQIMI